MCGRGAYYAYPQVTGGVVSCWVCALNLKKFMAQVGITTDDGDDNPTFESGYWHEQTPCMMTRTKLMEKNRWGILGTFVFSGVCVPTLQAFDF